MNDPLNISGLQTGRTGMDPRQLQQTGSLDSTPAKPFNEVLQESIGEVQRLQDEADNTIRQLVAGEIKDVSDAMVAVERADVAFQTMMVVRNKMVQAYEEVMRMQI
ncbi:MAG: flagellar hook-basal body complex protein FliE [Candidatus Hydrogenedentota bacterium]